MLIIFILVCTALLLKLSQMEEQVAANIEELKNASKVRSEILQDIFAELKAQGIDVLISDNDTILRIPENSFHFKTGSFEITEDLRGTAELIGRALYTAITREGRWGYLETVFVEGHSDSRKAPNYRMGNWELSALRAISLWQFWIGQTEYGPLLAQLRNREGKHLFSVSGYAATRRIAEIEDTEDAMRSNRRIDIRFTTRQPSIMEMEDVVSPLRGK
ncbi:OmpA/MotB family protein [Desulfovibrio piger]|uniref:OmpA/MotB family protein n=1 Tax=Desulfovibrio piger TaxID=901 RepID=UPI0026F1B5B2|nr:OmpA family protein [Desulfovibrio piger]MCI7616211.1 OmpA family protein [Desulfovibrio piger]